LRIRTVLDARPATPPRYLLQTLLLAHSWAAVGSASPLEVFMIGSAPEPVQLRLRELGVEVVPSEAHPLDEISKTANKLISLRAPSDGPIFFLDNDVCLLEDISDLEGRNVRAAIATGNRVSEEQWRFIAESTGLEPIGQEWIPLLVELKARRTGRSPRVETRLYPAAGLSWIRDPTTFEPIWAHGIELIARAFDDHPLATYRVRGSDMAGFAVAVREHGRFDLLPLSYNYRPVCFRLGVPEPKVLHLGELGRKGLAPFSQLLTAWWEKRILKPIARARDDGVLWPSAEEQEQLLDEAASVRDRVLAIGADAGLDAFVL
jgi:hypothetical protein